MFRRTLAFALPVVLLACGGDSDGTDANDSDTDGGDPIADIVGVYSTSFQGKSEDCGEFEELTLPTPFFEIVESSDVPGAIEVYNCRTATDCDDFANVGYVFEHDGENWEGNFEFSFFNEGDENGAQCALNAVRLTLKVQKDGGVKINRVQVTEVRQSSDFSGEEDCVDELDTYAPKFNTDPLNCERWDGDPV